MSVLSYVNTTRSAVPRAPFGDIKDAVLGASYQLSLVFMGDYKARTLNKTYRNKSTPANVLSFPLSKTEGEIFINLARARREAHHFGLSYSGHVQYLLIHALLHLKGLDHGSTMDRTEQALRKRFNIR